MGTWRVSAGELDCLNQVLKYGPLLLASPCPWSTHPSTYLVIPAASKDMCLMDLAEGCSSSWLSTTILQLCNIMVRLRCCFVRSMRHCMLPDYFELEQLKQQPFYWDDSYDNPSHLLGLLRYYIVGRSNGTKYPTPKTKNILFSMSAIKLDKIGIRLTANKTMKLIDMGLDIQGTGLFPKLSLAPLSLDHDCASYLVNMAAFELCTVKSFGNAGGEEHSAVCSYLTLLAMLVCREEDVHQLRERDILQGGGGLTNEERRWYEFYYSYGTIVLAAIGAIGTLAGIIASIMSHMRG